MLLAVLLAPALQPDAFAAPLDYTEADVRDVRGIYDDSLDGGRGLAESATPPFSSELAIKVAGPKKQLLLSFTNRIRVDFAFTWVAHIRALGLTNFLVGATDDVAVEELTTGKVPCFSMKTNLPQGEWPWGSSSFKALGPHKIELIYKSIQWGLEVVITDIDALADDGLEDHRGIHSAFNIGYMFFRPSAIPLVEEWRRYINEDPRNRWDQEPLYSYSHHRTTLISCRPTANTGEFNRIARSKWKPGRTDGLSDKRLFWAYQEKLAQRMGVPPYSIHTTFQYSAAAGKRHRLREAMVWIDEPSYYDPPGGLLVYAPDVPKALVHIELIRHQLRQIRSALALAQAFGALGRKLILPEVTCGYDKAWFQLSGGAARGAFAGAHAFILPIRKCPLDHFLELHPLHPLETLREFSLLSNPRTPAAVKGGVVTAEIDAGGGTGAVEKLAVHKTARVLNVSNLASVDTLPLLTTAQLSGFKQKFKFAGGGWCCAPAADKQAGMPNNAHFSLLRS
ncbi:hypothetical protein EMIHUDRAFT_459022 [Emiliania huxleyi CCMP1516]|uniref:Nucleotide-diphospho-sugar transferase domain-containing protein n=2 Tax=Emiliania huxleyi TaxID=2903 RepID=A0A0D3J113_EMIH1|nr:hypothetical protein EMIHUDRAFT_459022 [Emiliania huxleyi CCMP1516]EOD17198.1 hypothetical protein EMIHUDRAFT_459022 [Emiliania huxleyi CCMP1516]|eukprot:XP_005769627.1 hypothetical protein EMIHUDRAFT_459022 [Emiliania huxleyi CCMP1516]